MSLTRRLRRMQQTNQDPEGGFALVLSLLLILVVAGLSLSIAAVILNQAKPTQEARKQVQTINAAQAGLQVALGNLRAASDISGNGVLLKLPCSALNGASFEQGAAGSATASGATFSGAVTDLSGAPAYRVSLAYFRMDPKGKDPAWLKANAMPCPLLTTPTFAYLQSYGTGARVPGTGPTGGNRSQTAVYEFSTTNVNVEGGRIRSFGTQQCLDAGPNPVVGSTLTHQSCLALGTPQQTWQYRVDLTIFYGGDTGKNLCVRQPTSGNRAVLAACVQPSLPGQTYPYAAGQQVQEFGFNDNGHFSGALSNGTVTNGTGGGCLQPEGAGSVVPAPSGAFLVLVSCDASTTGPAAYDPDAQVGAGKAGGGTSGIPGVTRQYVSYAQFGRCLDITGQNVNAAYLIAYPCKQAPDQNTLTFNQVWFFEGVPGVDSGNGPFYVNRLGTKYCLQSPAAGNLVTTPTCNGSARQQWRATGKVAGNYAASYNLISKEDGRCLAVSPLAEAITFGSSTILVQPCDGSSAQKWNAPPIAPDVGFGNIQETVGG